MYVGDKHSSLFQPINYEAKIFIALNHQMWNRISFVCFYQGPCYKTFTNTIKFSAAVSQCVCHWSPQQLLSNFSAPLQVYTQASIGNIRLGEEVVTTSECSKHFIAHATDCETKETLTEGKGSVPQTSSYELVQISCFPN